MPFIRVTALGENLRSDQISRLQIEITDRMELVLDKVAGLTGVRWLCQP